MSPAMASKSSSALVTVTTSGNLASSTAVTPPLAPRVSSCASALQYARANGSFTVTTASSDPALSMVMNTSTLPRLTAFCTRVFTASSAKM